MRRAACSDRARARSRTTMPTAVFYAVEGPDSSAAPPWRPYVGRLDGRLMRSMKSIPRQQPGSRRPPTWAAAAVVKYLDIVAGYLRPEAARRGQAGAAVIAAVLGRPVFFVDDDPARDAQAQAALETAARQVEFRRHPLPVRADRRRLRPRAQHRSRGSRAGGRHRRRHLGLLHRCASARRARGASSARRHPRQPRRASPAPTSTARRARAILPEFGYGACTAQRGRLRQRARCPAASYFDLATR